MDSSVKIQFISEIKTVYKGIIMEEATEAAVGSNRVVVIGIDGSNDAKEAFHCKFGFSCIVLISY